MNSHTLLRIKTYIAEQTGIVYYQDKDKDLAYRIERRMQTLGIRDYDAYWHLLAEQRDGGKEFDQLVNVLTIGETYFFRDQATFKGLKEVVIPQVLEKNRQTRSLRIWSAGCASGEEAYSVSILLKREFPHFLADWDISILGTDINRDFIAQAIEGRYGSWSFRETPETIKQTCFVPQGKSWQIKDEYKKGAAFEYHNLAKNPFPSLVQNLVAFDIIFCRNVIIYFEENTIRKLLEQFNQSLVDKGWLIVGHADHNIKYYQEFQAVAFPGAYFYRKEKEPLKKTDQIPVFHLPGFPLPAQPQAQSTVPGQAWAPGTLPAASPIPSSPKTPPPTFTFPSPPPPPSPAPPPVSVTDIREAGMTELCRLANRGAWKEALALSRQLMEQDHLNPLVYFFQALIREQMGHGQEAEALLRKALYLDRQFVPGHYHLGLLLQKNKDIAGAKKSFANVSKLLNNYDKNYIFKLADNISASQLKELAEFNLEVLEKYEHQK